MKKGWRVFWIACGATAGLGIVFCLTGILLGAPPVLIRNYFTNGNGIGDFNAETGETFSETFADIRQIDVETAGTRVLIEQTDAPGGQIRVEAKLDRRLNFQCGAKNGELVIKTQKKLRSAGNSRTGTIRVYLPKDRMEEINLELASGELDADILSARNLSVEIGVGDGQIGWFEADEVNMDCGVGHLALSGNFSEEADIDCGIGEVEFTAWGRENLYNYEVQCGIGDVAIGGDSYSGLAGERNIYNGADRDMNIDCGIGSVSVYFEE